MLAMEHYHQISKHHNIDSKKSYRNKIYDKVKNYYKWSLLKNWYWKDIVWFLLFIYSPKNYMRLRDYMDKKVEKKLSNAL